MRVAETDTYLVKAFDDSGVVTIEQNYGGDHKQVKFQYNEIDLLISILVKAKESAKADRY